MPFSGPSTALIVVHLQHDIVSPGTVFGSLFNAEYEARSIPEKINQVAAAVRATGGLVVALRIAWDSTYSDFNEAIPLLAMVRQGGALVEGSTGAELVPALELADSDVVVTHTRPGPFTRTDLEAMLRGRGIDTVLVCGVVTNASVEGAVRQASDLDFRTFVVADAASAADSATHDASIASMGLFAGVVSVDEVVGSLGDQNG